MYVLEKRKNDIYWITTIIHCNCLNSVIIVVQKKHFKYIAESISFYVIFKLWKLFLFWDLLTPANSSIEEV